MIARQHPFAIDRHRPEKVADGARSGAKEEHSLAVRKFPGRRIRRRRWWCRVASLREVNWGRFETNFFAVFQPGVLEQAPQMFVTLVRVEAG